MARSFDEGQHMADHIDRKIFRNILEEARSAVAQEINNEKKNKSKVSKSNPSFFHNLVFRLVHNLLINKLSN